MPLVLWLSYKPLSLIYSLSLTHLCHQLPSLFSPFSPTSPFPTVPCSPSASVSAAELQNFCRDVPPSEGQAFKCLQGKLSEVGMSAACKSQVNLQEARQASNYRLDVSLRRECAADVAGHCAKVDEGREGHALVLKCLIGKYPNLTNTCQSEVRGEGIPEGERRGGISSICCVSEQAM